MKKQRRHFKLVKVQISTETKFLYLKMQWKMCQKSNKEKLVRQSMSQALVMTWTFPRSLKKMTSNRRLSMENLKFKMNKWFPLKVKVNQIFKIAKSMLLTYMSTENHQCYLQPQIMVHSREHKHKTNKILI